MADPRGFGLTVLAGLGAGALAAVASARPWVAPTGDRTADLLARMDGLGQAPLASAVSLVLLAAWGVLLVTRGAARRLAAAAALVAGVGLLATAGWAARVLPERVAGMLAEGTLAGGGARVESGLTGWFWVALAAAAAGLPAAAVALRRAPRWPQLGTRYDAPGGPPGRPDGHRDDESSLDYWRALDAGRDPTV